MRRLFKGKRITTPEEQELLHELGKNLVYGLGGLLVERGIRELKNHPHEGVQTLGHIAEGVHKTIGTQRGQRS